MKELLVESERESTDEESMVEPHSWSMVMRPRSPHLGSDEFNRKNSSDTLTLVSSHEGKMRFNAMARAV
jgi:hypothetical protein